MEGSVAGFLKRSGRLTRQCVKTHVQTIATHYSGKVASRDVVNEAINDGGGYRNSIFYQHTGAGYIEQAFINARAVAKTADLYYNDCNIEADSAKLQTLMGMLDGFKARAVPVTGVGFQMHMYMDYPLIVIKAYMETVPAGLRGGVTVWGVSNPGSWLIADLFKNAHADWPLLFDGSYQQKPALCGVADGLSGKACTND